MLSYYTFKRANNKNADHTVHACMHICCPHSTKLVIIATRPNDNLVSSKSNGSKSMEESGLRTIVLAKMQRYIPVIRNLYTINIS